MDQRDCVEVTPVTFPDEARVRAAPAFMSTAPLSDGTLRFLSRVGMPKVSDLVVEWTELLRHAYTLQDLGTTHCNGLDTARCVVVRVGTDHAFCAEPPPAETVWAVDRNSSARQYVNRTPLTFACSLSLYVRFVRGFDLDGPVAVADAVRTLEREMLEIDPGLDEQSWWHPILEEMRLGLW